VFDARRILVPTDFSDCSERALRVALSMASRQNSDVHLLHISPRPASGTYESDKDTKAEVKALETNEGALKTAYGEAAKEVSEATGLPVLAETAVHYLVAGGAPADEIVRIAEEIHADLIVLGTHGRTSVKEFFVGSTAERVLKNAYCNVLAVKPKGYPFLRD